MSNSGPGPYGNVELRVVLPYDLVLRVLRELDYRDDRQRRLADEVYATLPQSISARVEVEQETRP
jgi:hypothetical protein